MSRAQERSTGLQSGAQAPQQPTGNATGTGGNVTGTGNVTGATSASLRDPAATTSRARGTGTGASYQTSGGTGTGRVGAGGVLAMVAGLLTFFAGLAAVVRRSFYPTLPGYAYRLNVHTWGWILLVLGVLLFAAGATYLLGMSFGKIAGVGLAVLTAIAGFMFLAYTPVWGIILVALSVAAIWSLLSDDGAGQGAGGERYGDSSYGSSAMGSSSGTMSSGTTTTTTRSTNRM